MKKFLLGFSLMVLQMSAGAQSNPEKDFLKRNPSVKSIHWKEGNTLMLTTKSGATETYQLNKKEELTAFNNKYGSLPVAPPPPPPPPPPVPPVPDTERI